MQGAGGGRDIRPQLFQQPLLAVFLKQIHIAFCFAMLVIDSSRQSGHDSGYKSRR